MTNKEAIEAIKANYPPENYTILREALDKAINLLKASDEVRPYLDYDGQDVWRCGNCGNSLMHPSYYGSDEDVKNFIRYCSRCGKAVKWE